ncbi:MAG: YebC/PmpR family DNA-binding transcriptional regulator [Bacilli bacterium]|nr:YebC/PmpR family DNA-binding transcriptional regulator [Bacilli bacterium]
MGRFPNIAASKAKTGAMKAKLYSTFAKEIYLAAKSGVPEVDNNLSLRRVVEKAKKSQVPSDVIERAINKAKGSSTDDYQTIIYEGFGPGQSTLLIKTLTDNVNRTVAFVREAFNKCHKSLGVSNSVSYNYDYLALLGSKDITEEQALETLLDNGIEPVDIEVEDGITIISLNLSDHYKAKDILDGAYPNIEYELDEEGYYAKDLIELTGEDLELFTKLYNMLDDIEDVTAIYHNVKNF